VSVDRRCSAENAGGAHQKPVRPTEFERALAEKAAARTETMTRMPPAPVLRAEKRQVAHFAAEPCAPRQVLPRPAEPSVLIAADLPEVETPVLVAVAVERAERSLPFQSRRLPRPPSMLLPR